MLKIIPKCFILVRGEFGPAPESSAGTGSGPGDPAWTWPSDTLEQLTLAAPPDLYLELRPMVYGTSMALQPVFLDYTKAASELTSKDQKKDVIIVAEFTGALAASTKDGVTTTTTSADGVFARYLLVLPGLKIGSRFTEHTLAGLTTNVEPLPATKVNNVDNARGFGVKLVMSENENGGKTLAALGEALEKQESKINDAFASKLAEWLGKLMGS